MAEQFSLVRLNEFGADVDSLDLFTRSGGIALEYESWQPKASLAPGIVTESFTLVIVGTSSDTVATKLQNIEAKFQQVLNYASSSVEPYVVVLRDQLAGETGARQALCTGGYDIQLRESFHAPGYVRKDYRLTLDRVALWEATVKSTVTMTAISAYGGQSYTDGNGTIVTGEIVGTFGEIGLWEGGSLDHTQITPGSVTLHWTSEGVPLSATDDGAGHIYDGTINYGTGVIGTEILGTPGSNLTADYVYHSGLYSGMGGIGPGRIGLVTLKGISSKGTISELWAGFRTARFGALERFVSLWQAESGTDGTDTTELADPTAWPGGVGMTIKRCTFATETDLAKRLTLTAYQISNSYYADLRGTFDIIARMKLDTAGSVNVRLDSGILNGSTFTTSQIGDLVTVDSTTYKYYNLGRITWPALGRVTSALDAMKIACMALYAGRPSGTSYLNIDHFVPIPVDEGYIHADDLSVVYATNDTNARAEVYCDAAGNIVGVQYASGTVISPVDTRGMALETWFMPTAAALLIVAAQTASPALTDQLTLVFDVFKRYPTLRGAA